MEMKPKNIFVRKKKFKHTKLVIILSSLIILSIILATTFIQSIQTKALSIWQGIIAFTMGFILINGKFVLKAFLKKIFIISAIGLSKHFFIEKIFMENMMSLFIAKLPFKDFMEYSKQKVKKTALWAKAVWLFGLTATGITTIFFAGDIMLIKVILAKFWSAILAILSKFMIFIGYILLDSGWIRVLIEVLILGWILSIIQKIPFMHRFFIWLYSFIEVFIKKTAKLLEYTFNLPAQRSINKLTIYTSKWMHNVMNSEGYMTYHNFIIRHRLIKKNIHFQLNEYRNEIKLSNYKQLKAKKKQYKRPGNHISYFDQLQSRQKINFDVSKARMYLHKEHIL